MTRIGLDNSISSVEGWWPEDTNTSDQETGSPLATTPIKLNAANSFVLSKHVIIHRQDRVSEFIRKFSLGGH